MNDAMVKAHQYFNDSVNRYNNNNLEEALGLIEKAIELAPKASLYWSAKAEYQHDQGKYNEALISIEKAIQFIPKSASVRAIAWSCKGSIKQDMGEYRQAAEAYVESLKNEPDFNIYTLLSYVQLQFDPEAAIQSAKKALELNPDWEEAQDLLKAAMEEVEKLKQ